MNLRGKYNFGVFVESKKKNLKKNLKKKKNLFKYMKKLEMKYRISSYSCRGNYLFWNLGWGNYSKEETIDFLGFFHHRNLIWT